MERTKLTQAEAAWALPGKAAERILSCARQCFDRDGFEKPTVEDIAAAAGVSRQTVYNHFSSKRDIIDHITLREMMKIQDDIRRRIRRHERYGERIAEAVVLSVLIANDNPYIRRINYDPEASPQATTSGPVHAWYRERWRPVLEAGIEAGELKPDLDLDEVVGWLAFCQWVLQIKIDHAGIGEAEIRRFVVAFMVAPLLNGGVSTDVANDNDVAELRRQNALFREIVSEQALRIKQLEARLAAERGGI